MITMSAYKPNLAYVIPVEQVMLNRVRHSREWASACVNLNFKFPEKSTGLPGKNAPFKAKNCIFDWFILVFWLYEILFVDDKVHLGQKYGNSFKLC